MHARIQAHTVSLSQCHRQTIHSTRFDTTHTLTISKQVHADIHTYALLMSYFFVHASQTCFVCRHISFTHTHIQALKLSHCSKLYSVLPAVGGTKLIVELCDHVVRNTFWVGTAHQSRGEKKKGGINFHDSHITTWEGLESKKLGMMQTLNNKPVMGGSTSNKSVKSAAIIRTNYRRSIY